MKIITSTTIRLLAKEQPKDAKRPVFEHLAPGEHDLPDDVARDLLKRGVAKTPADAAKDAKVDTGPSVTKVKTAK